MSRKNFKTDADYRKAKRKFYKYYYAGTANYRPRFWEENEDVILINWDGTDRELSEVLKRSTKSIQHRRSRLKHCDVVCGEVVLNALLKKGWISKYPEYAM